MQQQRFCCHFFFPPLHFTSTEISDSNFHVLLLHAQDKMILAQCVLFISLSILLRRWVIDEKLRCWAYQILEVEKFPPLSLLVSPSQSLLELIFFSSALLSQATSLKHYRQSLIGLSFSFGPGKSVFTEMP